MPARVVIALGGADWASVGACFSACGRAASLSSQRVAWGLRQGFHAAILGHFRGRIGIPRFVVILVGFLHQNLICSVFRFCVSYLNNPT